MVRVPEPLRSWAINLTQFGAVGVPLAVCAKVLGATEVSRKISMMCGFVPRWVRIELPGTGQAHFDMAGSNGLDAVSRVYWWKGWGKFEKSMPDLFAAIAYDSNVVLDVGAYSGLYSLIAATVSPAAQVVAFEPYPPARELLEANLQRNKLNSRVMVLPISAGDTVGKAYLNIPTTTTGLLESAGSLESELYDETSEVISVPVSTLDEVKRELALGRISLIKMDVEAFEHRVLSGAANVMASDRPIIFMEILEDAHCAIIASVLAENGYCNSYIEDGGLAWRNVVEHQQGNNDHVLCPKERVDEVDALIDEIGLHSRREVD